ncbi:MAG: CDP-alcohol phosphatidyltransferase family protein [Clostridia bacterium]|nr:CDP-alcohol phosphatidyltransferase family protein [Clostridia bacterium]
MANIITSCRILCSIWMLFTPVFSRGFYTAYLLGGLTDMVDGTVARKTNTESKFGARLDTVADLIFTAVAMVKIFPEIQIPSWLWIWILLIAIVKVSNIISGFVCKKRLIVEHTLMNKITGILLFLLPLTLRFVELKYSAVILCSVATVSAIQEGHFIRTGREVV